MNERRVRAYVVLMWLAAAVYGIGTLAVVAVRTGQVPRTTPPAPEPVEAATA